MDPVTAASIALGVIGVFPTCVDGFAVIRSVFTANKEAEEQVGRVFTAWGEWWEIGKDNKNSKLREYLESGTQVGPFVLDTLSAISDTFANVTRLEGEYGLRVERKSLDLQDLSTNDVLRGRKSSEIGQKIEARRRRMNLLKACKFAVKDTKKFDRLAAKLIECIESLLKMCSERAADRVMQKIARGILKQVREENGVGDLESLSKAAKLQSEKKRREGHRYFAGYDLVAATAAFKAKTRRPAAECRLVCRKEDHIYEHGRWSFNDGEATVAICNHDDTIHYIEWKSYHSPFAGAPCPQSESDILHLSQFLSTPSPPPQLHILPYLGTFNDPANGRYGFVYRLPPYIADFSNREFLPKGAITKDRMPVSLLELIEQAAEDPRRGIVDLGVRFRIARMVVESVYVLHSAGWVHKNIRSKSVLFLPQESTLGGVPSKSGRKDLSNPFLFGFGYSRPEDPSQDRGRVYYSSVGQYNGDAEQSMREHTIKLDIYHHPAKRLNPKLRYRPTFDVYSLGCVLLEIGFWQSLGSFADPTDVESPESFRERLVGLTYELRGQAGGIYAEVVKKCLEIEVTERVYSDKVAEEVLCWGVAAALDRCMA